MKQHSKFLFIFLMFISSCNNYNGQEPAEINADYAEVNVIDLIHLVESKNKDNFSQLVLYTGEDSIRNLRKSLNIKIEEESEKNNSYFFTLQKIINKLREIQPETGDIDTEYTFVISDSYSLTKANKEAIRVVMKYCLPNEQECIDKSYFFDFIRGDNEYLLFDIDQKKLYK